MMKQRIQMRDFVTHYLQVLSSRDMHAIQNFFAEEVDWYIPGNEDLVSWIGIRSTKDEILDFFDDLWKQTQPLSARIDHILVDGDIAVVCGEFSSKILRSGKILNSIFSIQLTIENNLITRYRFLEDSYALSEAYKL